MKSRKRTTVIFALVLVAGVTLVAMTSAAPGSSLIAGGSPQVVAYQGEVRVSGSPYTGDGYFKFAMVNASGTTSYWSNDATSSGGGEPSAAVALAVTDGLFSVLLGDTSLGGMTQPLSAAVFNETERTLRVWFSTTAGGPFDRLAPDTRIAAVPYALQAQEAANADTVDGLHAGELGADYQNVAVVAKSGGDFTSVQAAIDSITGASSDNSYLVWVAPGVYEEQVTMKPYVHLQGAGQEVTIITSSASSSDWPPTQGTLQLDTFVSVRDLTVQNVGTSDQLVAILAMEGTTNTTVTGVTAYAGGPATHTYAIAITGNSAVTLQNVSASAALASDYNIGIMAHGGAQVQVRGGSFTATGGDRSWAAFVTNSGTTLVAVDVPMLAEGASLNNTAIHPYDGAEVVLRGGIFTARGGEQTNAIGDQLNSTVSAYDVVALAEDGLTNYGLGPFDGSSMVVRGATVTARGGESSYAVTSESNATLDAESVISVAENGSYRNYGLYVSEDARATVRGGSYTGRGGTEAWGILNQLGGASLDAEAVTALGENASSINCGLANESGALATIRGGSFTGRGGDFAYGIRNYDENTSLGADFVTALGENAGYNVGLRIDDGAGASATLHGGSFIGRGGERAFGIVFTGSDNTITADGISALGENASVSSKGMGMSSTGTMTADSSQFTGSPAVDQSAGTLRLAVSKLDGGPGWDGGSVTCFQVYDGNYTAVTCP